MIKDVFRIVIVIFWMMQLVHATSNDEKHIEVIMRSVGHEILLNYGDSNSLVLPIETKENQYNISFETGFSFVPEDLVSTVRNTIDKTGISKNYIVEVKKCETREVAYSFEVDLNMQQDIVACKSREQPEDCYTIVINLLDKEPESNSLVYALLPVSLLLIFVGIGFRKRRKEYISLGNYQFDSSNFCVYFNGEKIELTSKEANLLMAFFENKNQTVKKEDLLSKVWDDEGDYVGRTLDVYVSKLRKKLDKDDSVKIINSRGEGYRLVCD